MHALIGHVDADGPVVIILASIGYVDLGGPVVITLATGSEVRGFKLDRGRWIFSEHKILSMISLGRKVKPWVPCRRFTARKRTSKSEIRVSKQNLSDFSRSL